VPRSSNLEGGALRPCPPPGGSEIEADPLLLPVRSEKRQRGRMEEGGKEGMRP
jgi:hypothetical protein